VVAGALIARQHPQRVHRQLRIQRQRLVGGNDGVAAEDGGEPRNAGGDDALVSFRNLQRVEIADGGEQGFVKNFIVRFELGGALFPGLESFAPLAQAAEEIRLGGGAALAQFAHVGHRDKTQIQLLQRLQLQLPSGDAIADFVGRGRKADLGVAFDLVESAVGKDQEIFAYQRLEIMAVALANASAHLKYIHEIGVEGDFHHKFYWREMEIFQSQLVEQHIAG